jgi:hypothetical protein
MRAICPYQLRTIAQVKRHLHEFLATFGYESPSLRDVAIDAHFRIEPIRVIESASL